MREICEEPIDKQNYTHVIRCFDGKCYFCNLEDTDERLPCEALWQREWLKYHKEIALRNKLSEFCKTLTEGEKDMLAESCLEFMEGALY